ncbi:hypothetical protein SUGI_0191810 [Cryptomeria japonica]|nr:hypothetical protein SUGI_0191810 [Cryptomeria japonica]
MYSWALLPLRNIVSLLTMLQAFAHEDELNSSTPENDYAGKDSIMNIYLQPENGVNEGGYASIQLDKHEQDFMHRVLPYFISSKDNDSNEIYATHVPPHENEVEILTSQENCADRNADEDMCLLVSELGSIANMSLFLHPLDVSSVVKVCL